MSRGRTGKRGGGVHNRKLRKEKIRGGEGEGEKQEQRRRKSLLGCV